MLKKILLALGLSLITSSAWAVCGAIPLTIKDASNATQNISSATAGDGNCKTYIDADTSSNLNTLLVAPEPLKALSAEPSQATTTNPVPAYSDLVGKQVTSPYANRENMLRCAVTITASTAATTCTGMGAQGASVKIYITNLCVMRSDAGTTADVFTLNDSATTILILPNTSGGGGVCVTYNVPLVVAANTAFTGASTTSLSSVYMSATGFSGY